MTREEARERAELNDAGELECPECGSLGGHETNGESSLYDLSFLCVRCGTQFDAMDV